VRYSLALVLLTSVIGGVLFLRAGQHLRADLRRVTAAP
jgi:hypothetical protein